MVAHHAYTPTEADVLAVRSKLTVEENEIKTEDVERFLRADKGNVATTTARLKETLKWREEVQPEKLVCRLCQEKPGSHYMHPIGFDLHEQPVLYSCLSLASDRSLKGNREHMIVTFEQSVKMMRPGVEKWVWFSDFHGFGFKDLSPTLGKAFLELASKHYPERLACFVLCDTPSIFQTLYNMMMPLMDPVTKAKIRLIPYDIDKEAKKPGSSKLRHFMDEMFPPETSEWILHEMAENRSKHVKNAKQYSQTEVYAAAKANGDSERHWGSSALWKRLVEHPELLLPNASVM